ncbi:MAG: four helix bundle protein [Candidatus Taylorbacteria bacterium]
MQYKSFEDIKVWQDSRNLAVKSYKLINSNSQLRKDYALSDQFRRATCSIMLNIAEGFERTSKREFAYFLNIAKGSAGEVRSILYIMKDVEFINEEEFNQFYVEVKNISMQLCSFRNFLIR